MAKKESELAVALADKKAADDKAAAKEYEQHAQQAELKKKAKADLADASKDGERLGNELAEQKKAVARLTAQLADSNAALAKSEKELADTKKKAAAASESELESLHEEVSELSQQIVAKDKELQGISSLLCAPLY